MVNHYDDFLDMERLRNTLKVKRVNDELLEYLESSLRWIIHYCRKHDIPLPDDEKIIDLCNGAIEIERKLPKLPDELLQRHKTNGTDADDTEPYIETPQRYFASQNGRLYLVSDRAFWAESSDLVKISGIYGFDSIKGQEARERAF